MKKLIVFILALSLMSCGIKKELETANRQNEILTNTLKELRKEKDAERTKLEKCTEMNTILYKENKEFAAKINSLQNGNTNDENTEIIDEIYTEVEVMPNFPGGQARMLSFIGKKVRYPAIAKENNIQGKVYVQFVINKDGSISDAQVLRGIGGGCDEEALRAVNAMPNWIPGEQRGKPVRTRFVLPVNFQLR